MAPGKGLERLSESVQASQARTAGPGPTLSASVSVRRGLKMCFSNTLTGGTKDAGPETTV